MISVIINVYNCEKYIRKCLDSIINQTYKDLEILIVNDGSSDGTLKICESYKDERIKIVTTKNQGLSLSRNTGIDNAKGDYLYFIDADDYIEADTLDYLYGLIKKYNVEIATCRALAIYDYNFTVKQKKEKIHLLSSMEMLNKIVLEEDFAVTTWNKLVSKKLYNNLRFEDRISDDMAFTHKQVVKTDKIAFSNQIKYYYLKHSDSITGTKASTERLVDGYKVCLERFHFIKYLYPQFPANNAGFLKQAVRFSTKKNAGYDNFFRTENCHKTCREIFTMKILFTRLNFREKIKILLFVINPNICNKIIDIYLTLLRKKCS
jgi:glycosyltransferase involved in cell wall biosynthesis